MDGDAASMYALMESVTASEGPMATICDPADGILLVSEAAGGACAEGLGNMRRHGLERR
jgi:hypothetical protein